MQKRLCVPVTLKRSVIIKDILVMLRMIFTALVYPPWYDRSLNQIRAQMTIAAAQTLTTVTTVGTVTTITGGTITTLTGLTNIDSYQGKLLMTGANMTAWATGCRARIT